ncbi:MAG TPA: FHA domain-containing protein [bacterium]
MSEEKKHIQKDTVLDAADSDYLLLRMVPENLIVSLLIVEGEKKGRKIYIRESPMFIGRDEGMDIVFDDHSISREHAVIYFYKGRFEAKDLGSTNGIFVNGKRHEKAELKNRDTLKVGKILMRFIIESREP